MQSVASGFDSILVGWRLLLAGLGRIDLRAFVRDICRALHRTRRDEGGECCARIPGATYKRADPLLYSQYWLMSQGIGVTWDNPDIQIVRGGVPVPPGKLQTDTDYDVVIRIWNGSYDGAAVGLPVRLSYLSFGIGTASHAVGQNSVDLGVKASATCPAFATIPWRTPATPGHYCLQALLDWPDDANPANNLGQKNTQVGTATSPAVLTFLVRNGSARNRRFTFETDAYRLPERPPCPTAVEAGPVAARARPPASRLAESRQRWATTRTAQGYGAMPLPAGWSVVLEPADLVLSPGQEVTVTATVTPPGGWTGRQPVNVHGFATTQGRARELVGGVTLLVEAA